MMTKIRIPRTLALSALALAMGWAAPGLADDGVKRVIALKTDHFELAETDVSHLAVGESETIVTESGTTIDLLRTADGIEIYVDGELLELPHADHHDGAQHKVARHVVVHCADDEQACVEEHMAMEVEGLDLGEPHDAEWHDEEADVIVIRKKITKDDS